MIFPDKKLNDILAKNTDLLRALSKAKNATKEKNSTSMIFLSVCIQTVKCLNQDDKHQANQLKEILRINQPSKWEIMIARSSKLHELVDRTLNARPIVGKLENITITDEGYLLPRKTR